MQKLAQILSAACIHVYIATTLILVHWAAHRILEPIVINEGYVFVQEFCYTFSKYKIIDLYQKISM